MPQNFSLEGEIVLHSNVVLIINGPDIVCFTVTGAKVTGGSIQTVKTPQDLLVQLIDENTAYTEWKRGD